MKKFYFLLLGLFMFSGVNAQIINFPDANFKAKLLAANTNNQIAKDLDWNYFKVDANSDGQIQISEALQVSYLDVRTSSISSLDGIQNFIHLNWLNCSNNNISTLSFDTSFNLSQLFCDNNHITLLNIGTQTNLSLLSCNNNLLTTLDLSAVSNLFTLICSNNRLATINIENLTGLNFFDCSYNLLQSIDIDGMNIQEFNCSHNSLQTLSFDGLDLRKLYCNHNQLSILDVSTLTNLQYLTCNNNQITSLNIDNLLSLNTLNCGANYLQSLDINQNTGLYALNCSYNQLTSLFIRNGVNQTFLSNFFFNNNPNLQYVCSDDNEITGVQDLIILYGYTNCHVNTYCSFVPGGVFYTIQGNTKYDSNNNGCDVTDISFPNLNFSISNSTVSGNIISNSSGSYTVPVQAGTHTITPVFENSTYFNVSPATLSISFPSQASPFTQNYCVSANGIHPDLEVTLLPLNAARPGFDAKYRIIYKNKGNTFQSGSVNLTFNDAVLDLIVSNPVTSNQSLNNLSWDFINLLPFETREITVTLNVNSPMETPAVNGGDILNYNATFTSVATDDMPNDNTFAYNQTVVNAFDPNDKTCLEGATITPAKVGDYVHYMIRFENTGTFPAENIVVKDLIDLSKFDISTLVPIKGSHSFVTNITSGNKVEFIFENINLPFDDANNDGYVAFKIKTKPTLVLGNTFSNTASIYFDYNFPIVTNTATTTIAVLATQDFVFSKYFSVYPNPVAAILNITAKETIEVTSISIYNTLGQLVLVIPNAQDIKTVDVSGLTKGNYFIKINSDKGISNTKFIKN